VLIGASVCRAFSDIMFDFDPFPIDAMFVFYSNWDNDALVHFYLCLFLIFYLISIRYLKTRQQERQTLSQVGPTCQDGRNNWTEIILLALVLYILILILLKVESLSQDETGEDGRRDRPSNRWDHG
jgi:hypothetical protein